MGREGGAGGGSTLGGGGGGAGATGRATGSGGFGAGSGGIGVDVGGTGTGGCGAGGGVVRTTSGASGFFSSSFSPEPGARGPSSCDGSGRPHQSQNLKPASTGCPQFGHMISPPFGSSGENDRALIASAAPSSLVSFSSSGRLSIL
jgi:hypothetical protein